MVSLLLGGLEGTNKEGPAQFSSKGYKCVWTMSLDHQSASQRKSEEAPQWRSLPACEDQFTALILNGLVISGRAGSSHGFLRVGGRGVPGPSSHPSWCFSHDRGTCSLPALNAVERKLGTTGRSFFLHSPTFLVSYLNSLKAWYCCFSEPLYSCPCPICPTASLVSYGLFCTRVVCFRET